jgi:hypothetical protein
MGNVTEKEYFVLCLKHAVFETSIKKCYEMVYLIFFQIIWF